MEECFINQFDQKEFLFLADLQIDTSKGLVTTITGTGNQGDDKEGGKCGTDQEVSSPWDVEVAFAPG